MSSNDQRDSLLRRDRLAVAARSKSALRNRQSLQQRAELEAQRKSATSAALRLRPLSTYRFKPGAPTARRVLGAHHRPDVWRHRGVSGHSAGKANDNKSKIRFGRGAAQAIAYVTGDRLIDPVTGQAHDFQKKSVLYAGTCLPAGSSIDPATVSRQALAVEIERSAYKKSENLALEIVDPIDAHLTEHAKNAGGLDELLRDLADRRAQQLSDATGTACVVAVHPPDEQGDQRNYHLHTYIPTRQLVTDEAGRWHLGPKLRHMQRGQHPGKFLSEVVQHWADVQMRAADELGLDLVLDYRSNLERGLDRLPTIHVGRDGTEAAARGHVHNAVEFNARIHAINRIAARNPEVAVLVRDELQRQHRERSNEARRERRALVKPSPTQLITQAIERALPPDGQKMPLPTFMARLLAQGVVVVRPSVTSGGNLNGLRYALVSDPKTTYSGKQLAVFRNGKKSTPYTFPKLESRGVEFLHARDYGTTQDGRALATLSRQFRAELAPPTPVPQPQKTPPLTHSHDAVARIERAIDDLDLEL